MQRQRAQAQPSASPAQSAVGQRCSNPATSEPFAEAVLSVLSRENAPQSSLTVDNTFREGRGLAATRTIRRNEALLKVPSRCVLSPSRCDPSLASSLPEWACLAATLAVHAEHPGSYWHAYAQSLPHSSGNALEWSPTELDALQGSPWFDEAIDRRSTVADALPAIQDAVVQTNVASKPPAESSIVWAYSMLFSRLIRLKAPNGSNDSEELAMIPWADLINHGLRTNSFVQLENNACVLRPDYGPTEPGEQVFASYGSRPSGELLVSYGFVPPEYSPAETVPIALSLNNEDPMLSAKERALQRRKWPLEATFPLRLGEVPEGLLQFAGFASVECDTEDQVEQCAREAFDGVLTKLPKQLGGGPAGVGQKAGTAASAVRGAVSKLPGVTSGKPPGGNQGKVDARRAVADACRELLYEYPTSFEEDKARAKESAQGRPAETAEDVEACAAAVRFRERAILSRVEYVLRGEAAELGSKALSLPW